MREVYSNYANRVYDYLRSEYFDGISIYRLERFLSAAGLFGRDATLWFILSHLGITLGAWLLTAIAWHFLFIGDTAFWNLLLFGLILGLILPTIVIFFLRYRAQKKIVVAVTTVLELICVASEFGAATDEIIRIVVKVMHLVGQQHLASLMQKLSQDLSRLPSREQAWARLQAKIPSDEFADMIKLISQSDLHGSEMLLTQRRQLDSVRSMRIQKIEKAADIVKGKLSMVFILTLLPAFLIMMFGSVWLDFKQSEAYRLFDSEKAIDFDFKKNTNINIKR